MLEVCSVGISCQSADSKSLHLRVEARSVAGAGSVKLPIRNGYITVTERLQNDYMLYWLHNGYKTVT